jgi:mannose-6-phosphate isomerase-like protein (cupin superfamily)
MGTRLTGGCLVGQLRDGDMRQAGTLRSWSVVSCATGAEHVALRTLEFATGESPALRSETDDIWYVLDGSATLELAGHAHDVNPGTGIYIAPGQPVQVRNAGAVPLVVASVRCPDPESAGTKEIAADVAGSAPTVPPLVRLADRPRATTGDRWYVELVNDAVGSRHVTQFVGSIPPGRAPDHYHHYEEVIVVLAGRGIAWAGPTQAPIAAGSCIYLPKKQLHCLENTGDEPLLLVGVFYPAGSPAVRYEPGSSATERGSMP